MTIRFKKDFDAGAFLSRLGKDRTVDPSSGKVSYHSLFEHLDLVEMLFDGLETDAEIPEVELRSALRRALNSEPFTLVSTKQKLNRFATQYLKREATEYLLITTVSAVGQMPTIVPDPGGCQLSFSAGIPAAFSETRREKLKTAEHMLHSRLPERATYACVSLVARSDHQAAEKALDAIDLQRGLWNFLLNSMTLTRITTGGIRRPVNLICLGPVHTLHFPDGRLASDVFWYEPDYVDAAKAFDITGHAEELAENAKILTNQIDVKSPEYAALIRAAFMRYSRILDDASWETAFVGLWSLLEFLTGTTRADYDRMVKRVAFLFEDHEYVRQVLGQLRDHRNKAIHSGKYPSSIEMHLHRLKQYVHQAMLFHLRFQPSFDSLADATEFLDQPIDAEANRKRMSLAELALRFRQSNGHDPADTYSN